MCCRVNWLERDVISGNGHSQWPPLGQSRREVFYSSGRYLEELTPQNCQLPNVHHSAPQSPCQQLPKTAKTSEVDKTFSTSAAQHPMPPGPAGPQWASPETHLPRAAFQWLHPVRYWIQLCHGNGLCDPCASTDGPAWSILQLGVVYKPHTGWVQEEDMTTWWEVVFDLLWY